MEMSMSNRHTGNDKMPELWKLAGVSKKFGGAN